MSDTNLPQHSIVDDFIASVCHEHVEILYKDDDILLINKPSGLYQSAKLCDLISTLILIYFY